MQSIGTRRASNRVSLGSGSLKAHRGGKGSCRKNMFEIATSMQSIASQRYFACGGSRRWRSASEPACGGSRRWRSVSMLVCDGWRRWRSSPEVAFREGGCRESLTQHGPSSGGRAFSSFPSALSQCWRGLFASLDSFRPVLAGAFRVARQVPAGCPAAARPAGATGRLRSKIDRSPCFRSWSWHHDVGPLRLFGLDPVPRGPGPKARPLAVARRPRLASKIEKPP